MGSFEKEEVPEQRVAWWPLYPSIYLTVSLRRSLGAHFCNLFELPFCFSAICWLVGWMAGLDVTSGQSFINNDVIGYTGRQILAHSQRHRRVRGTRCIFILSFMGPGQAKGSVISGSCCQMNCSCCRNGNCAETVEDGGQRTKEAIPTGF